MTDLTKLGIHSCIRTGILKFSLEDEDCYASVENDIVNLFKNTEFADNIKLHTSDDEFLDLYLSGYPDPVAFNGAAMWLLENLRERGAILESVEGHFS